MKRTTIGILVLSFLGLAVVVAKPQFLAHKRKAFQPVAAAGGGETNTTARPVALLDNTGVWTTSPLWSDLDDVVGDGDASLVTSDGTPLSTEPFTVDMSDTLDPSASTWHVLRMKSSKATLGGANYDIICELRQGYVNEAGQGTLIAGVTNLDESGITLKYDIWNLTASQADAITDYTDLQCRCYAGKNGGGGNTAVRIADIEFQVRQIGMIDDGLIVRYWMDEATSGTGPTTLTDAGLGTNLDLTITYASAMVWTNESTGSGLLSENTTGDQRARKDVDLLDKYIALIHGGKVGTMEMVVKITDVSGSGGRIAHCEAKDGSDGSYSARGTSVDSLEVFIRTATDGTVNRATWDPMDDLRMVVHYVFNTAEATLADRIKIYTNGVEVVETAGTITADDPIDMDEGGRELILFNRESSGSYARSFAGVLYYYATYAVALDSQQVTSNYNRLILNDDL